jgi:hypothetical protein
MSPTASQERKPLCLRAGQETRRNLDHDVIEDDDLAMLLFGHQL